MGQCARGHWRALGSAALCKEGSWSAGVPAAGRRCAREGDGKLQLTWPRRQSLVVSESPFSPPGKSQCPHMGGAANPCWRAAGAGTAAAGLQESKLPSSRREQHRFLLQMAAEKAVGLQRLPGSWGWVLIAGAVGRAVLSSGAIRRWTGVGRGPVPNGEQVTGWDWGATDRPQPKISCDGRRAPRMMGIAVSGAWEHHPPRGAWGTVQRL